jgi:hypothetical protein
MLAVISFSQLSQSLKTIARQVMNNQTHFIVSKFKEPVFAIVPIAEYEKLFSSSSEKGSVTPEDRQKQLDQLSEAFM